MNAVASHIEVSSTKLACHCTKIQGVMSPDILQLHGDILDNSTWNTFSQVVEKDFFQVQKIWEKSNTRYFRSLLKAKQV